MNNIHLMIEKRYQGNGCGKEALKLAVDFIKTSPSGKAEYCWLSYEPENEVVRNLYLSFGSEEKKELWKEDQEIPLYTSCEPRFSGTVLSIYNHR